MTLDQAIVHVMPTAQERVTAFYPFFLEFMAQYSIVTKLREAAFLATIAEESGELRYTRELWGPTPQQETYEGRIDLGNNHPGDGKLFRGRGLIQVTGRGNYAAMSKLLGIDYLADPSQMQTPKEATRTACAWWDMHGCNELADIPDFEKVTRKVNGGLTHYTRRLTYYERALEVL